MLFSSKRNPNLKNYTLLSDCIHIADTKYIVHSPCNFDDHNSFIKPKQYVALSHLDCLLSSCNQFSTEFLQHFLP